MTLDPLSVYRRELRGAAERRVRSYQRRRRALVLVAVAGSAILLVGAAIAAQSHWLSASSRGELELGAPRRQFDRLAPAFRACMAAHGAQPERLANGGWTYNDVAAAESACGAYVTGITVTCKTIPGTRGGQANTARCVAVAHMAAGVPPRLRRRR